MFDVEIIAGRLAEIEDTLKKAYDQTVPTPVCACGMGRDSKDLQCGSPLKLKSFLLP